MNGKKMSYMGIGILMLIFGLFYGITTFVLDKKVGNNQVDNSEISNQENNQNKNEIEIVNNIYQNIKILYDVVNNRFKVSQEETLFVGDITYKKITNFNSAMSMFTEKGKENYLKTLNNYFAKTDNGVYLAGNLVSYQTYYFRGDNSNIYLLESKENVIKAIIYEKWTSNNTNTLATIELLKNNNKWLVDNLTILSNK